MYKQNVYMWKVWWSTCTVIYKSYVATKHAKGGFYSYSTNQNIILSMFAIKSVKQTKGENPSAFPDLWMSLYCGINGTTPPKIIAAEHIQLMMLRMVNSGSSMPPRRPAALSTILSLPMVCLCFYKLFWFLKNQFIS